MNNFRNNRKNRFKSNGERNLRKRPINGHKNHTDFNPNSDFKHRNPGRNNHNAPKLIEKYNNLAREALSSGDKILSENYFQHADHFTRILSEQGNLKKKRFNENLSSKSITEEKVDDKNTQLSDNSEENSGSTSQNEIN